MYLTSIIASGNNPYLEYAWVCAPNGAGQAITANTITTLSCDTRVSDFYSYGSINSNQLTLSAGTYQFYANAPILCINDTVILSLYNVTSSSYISRISYNQNNYYSPINSVPLIGQFTILTPCSIQMQAVTSAAASVRSSGNSTLFSSSVPGADQRTTIKLWKLA